ncbi:MAG: AI-2E family transporter [Flammeovirgaceae bacterium]
MEKEIRTIRILLSFLVGVLFVYLIGILSSMLIPLALALFMALLLQPVLAWLERKSIPFVVSLLLISVVAIATLFLCGRIFISTYNNLLKDKNRLSGLLKEKLQGIFDYFNQYANTDLNWDTLNKNLGGLLSYDWLLDSSGAFATFISDLTGSFVLTLLYFVAFLGGILQYESYIDYLADKKDTLEDNKMLKAFEEVKNSIVTYMKVKFFASLLTGLSFTIISWIFGIDFALFWGFLAFILNFIPNIGSIIATIPPILLAMIELNSTSMLLISTLLFIAVQFYFGNILEPKWMGSSLSLNTVTFILGLVFWGKLWGITGMLLSVPLLVLTKVILSQFPDAKLFVRLMGTFENPNHSKKK